MQLYVIYVGQKENNKFMKCFHKKKGEEEEDLSVNTEANQNEPMEPLGVMFVF